LLGTIDIIIIAAYLVLLILLGIYLRNKADQGISHFFLSGKKLPWWIAGTSMAASAFSADTPLYVTDITRNGGIGANWEWWCYAIGGAFSVYYLARLWRRAGVLTDIELAELRYDGLGARILRASRAIIFSCIINCIAMALVIKAISQILGESLNIDPAIIVPICLVVTLSYSLLSGFWGVVVSDFLQFFLALFGAILLAYYAVTAVGGMDEMLGQLSIMTPEKQPFNLLPRESAGFWGTLPAMLIIMLGMQWWAFINSDGGGKIIQRQLACKDETAASNATLWFLFTHYVLRTWPWIIVALCSMVLIPETVKGTSAYTAVMLKVLPEGRRGFMIATFLAAFMSTIDTQLNWGTSYFVNDFYSRFLKPQASQKHLLVISRLMSIIFLALAGIITFYTDSVTSIFRFMLSMGAGVGPIYLLRWFWWRINAWSELVAMISSMITATYCRSSGMPLQETLLITLAVSLPLAIIVTYLTPPVSDKQLVEFTNKTRPFGFWGKYRTAENKADSWLPAFCGWISLTISLFLLLFGTGWIIFGRLLSGLIPILIAIPFAIYAVRQAGKKV